MGNKYPIDYQFTGLLESDSIYTQGNSYGYCYHVNHPIIRKLYQTYKEERKIPVSFPLSDKERYHFEKCVDAWLKKQAR